MFHRERKVKVITHLMGDPGEYSGFFTTYSTYKLYMYFRESLRSLVLG